MDDIILHEESERIKIISNRYKEIRSRFAFYYYLDDIYINYTLLTSFTRHEWVTIYIRIIFQQIMCILFLFHYKMLPTWENKI